LQPTSLTATSHAAAALAATAVIATSIAATSHAATLCRVQVKRLVKRAAATVRVTFPQAEPPVETAVCPA